MYGVAGSGRGGAPYGVGSESCGDGAAGACEWAATQGPSVYGLSDVNGDPTDVKFQSALRSFQAILGPSAPSALRDGRARLHDVVSARHDTCALILLALALRRLFGDTSAHAARWRDEGSTIATRARFGQATASEYPTGRAGIRRSLEEVVKWVQFGVTDPVDAAAIRGWLGRALIAAGRPQGARAQTQALKNALESQTMYLSDPVGKEWVGSAATTLCLKPEHCLPAEDCDGLTVALATADAIGWNSNTVGQARIRRWEAATHLDCNTR